MRARDVRGLYAIIDTDFLGDRGVGVVEFAERVLSARVPILQLRAKKTAPTETLALLRRLREPCSKNGTLLFANDRPDLAVMAGCDGVHVGQDDLEVCDVRRFAPELLVGVSTHDEDQLDAALALNVDYVAFGPVFATRNKEQPDPTVGLDGLEHAARAARARACPLVAIGGIDLDNAGSVAAHADLGAVISALWPDNDGLDGVTARARALALALVK